MDRLPNELLIYLCSWLSRPSLKAFRLCNRNLADAGQNELFRDFEYRLLPRQQKLAQLESLAACPDIASKLKCLSFESGILLEYADYRYWHAQVMEEARRLNGSWTDPKGKSEFHTALQARFTPGMQHKYNLYRSHLDHEAALIAKQCSFRQLLSSLTVLSKFCSSVTFKIVMAEPKVTLEDVERFDVTSCESDPQEDADPRRRVTNRRQHTLDHFTSFLTAAHRCGIPFHDLVMIDVPRQMLYGNGTFVAETLPDIFAGLRSLDLRIASFPWSDWLSRSGIDVVYLNGRDPFAQRLRRLLDCAAGLESLRLEFPSGKEAEYSYDIFDRTNLSRFPRKFVPNLRQLELYNFRCSWEDLNALLQEAYQLKSLTLANCRLETYSMVDLIRAVPALKLQKASLFGRWYVDQDGGSWHAHSSEDFADCTAATSYEGPYISNGMRSLVEEYMIRGGRNCPLPEWSPFDEDGDGCPWELIGDTSWHFLREAAP